MKKWVFFFFFFLSFMSSIEARQDDETTVITLSPRRYAINEEANNATPSCSTLFSEDELPLLESLNKRVFEKDDLLSAQSSRWLGRALGIAAVNAIVPMILYVVLNLFDMPKSGELEWAVTALTLAYLFLPSMENIGHMGQTGHDFVRDSFCPAPKTQIPQEFKGESPAISRALQIASGIHAGAMSLILTTNFHHIENSKEAPYDWFFWTFFAPYACAIFYKNISFFNHGRTIQTAHHIFEGKQEKEIRQTLKEAIKSFESRELRKLDYNKLKKLYARLTDSTITIEDKLGAIHDHKNTCNDEGSETLTFRMDDGSTSSTLEKGSSIISSAQNRQTYSRPWTFRKAFSKQATNLVFYGSMIPEYVFYQFGLGLVCQNFGSSVPTANGISHFGAVILSLISFTFERMSIQEFYNSTLNQKFGDLLSVSNPVTRKGIGVKSFLTGGGIALSEIYPSWKAVLSGNYASYPLLGLMTLRHHARNMFWLQSGYERIISNWHARDCWRDSPPCKGSCGTGENREQMVNHISLLMRQLSDFSDHLNAKGIRTLYKAWFGHEFRDNHFSGVEG